MAQDNPLSVVTPQSLHYMRDYPPPSNVFKPESGSVNMSALHPPLPPPPPPPQAVMSPVRPNQWIRPQWLPPPGPMGQMPPVGPLRPIRPRRRAEPILFPRVGPHMWRGNRFMRGGRDNYNPGRKPRARFRNPHRKADDESTNSGSPDKSKANGLSKDSPNKNVSIKVERMDDAKKTITEKCVRKAVRKRKPISEFYPSKPWNRQDAEKALKVELEAYKKQVKTLIIKFPDPDLSWDIIRSYHKAIEKVHFQVPSGPREEEWKSVCRWSEKYRFRYCFIQLSDDSNVDQVIADLKEVDFHNLGKIKVEKKFEKPEGNVEPESIDPYTLYIGNLPLTINASLIKEKFPTAARIDVGYAQKMKYTRYAFIRYQTVEESIEAFKASHNIMFDSRNLIVRFRRQKGKNSMDLDLGTKMERREKRKLMECKRHMEDLKKMAEKKIKREQVQSDQNHEPRLEDLLRIGESSEEDDEEEEESPEEKEVDDEENDDDDEIVNEPWKIEGIHEDEDEDDDDEEEEDEDDDDDEDEDENDDDVEEEEEDDEEDDK